MENESISGNGIETADPVETTGQTIIESVSANDAQVTVSVGDAGTDITDETGTPMTATETDINAETAQVLAEIRDINTGILTAVQATLFLVLVIWCVEKVQKPVRRFFYNAKSD